MKPAGTDDLLALDEAELLRHCRVEFYKSGGPGGQKRNKTSSAARVVHRDSGLEGHSADFRSQAENRTRALHRLRLRLAAERRTPVQLFAYEPAAWVRPYTAGGQLHLNVRNPEFARLAATVLDLLQAADGNLPRVAALLGVSASSLVKWLRQEHQIWDAACRLRRAAGLPGDPFG
jgi:hypothetical protein